MNLLVLELFNKAIPQGKEVEYSTISSLGLKVGILIHPDLCNKEVLEWLKSKDVDYNSTFYKTWGEVTSKSRWELALDQIRHYASTYGTNFEGEAWIPEGKIQLPDIKNYKVITPITKEEVITRCEKMLFSGMALSSETINKIFLICDWLKHTIDLEKVRNKEAKMSLHKTTGTTPKSPVEMVRFLIYLATGKTLLIKNKEVYKELVASRFEIGLWVEAFGYERMATVFNRYKPIFLAFRSNPKNRPIVNQLRRLSVKHHVPVTPAVLDNVLNVHYTDEAIRKALSNVTIFKKIALLQAINVREKGLNNQAYVVRNQKLYIKEGRMRGSSSSYLTQVYTVVYMDLIESLKAGACSVKLPKGANITLPTSEKSFIGNYPLGTSFDFSESDNIVGIHWMGKDGARDLDLKMLDINGNIYGWNAAYYNDNNSIVYSGDVTSASPEATELFYASKGFNPAIVKVNLYNGQDNSKFRFFIAREEIHGRPERNYMVNPDNILVNVECQMDSKEKSLGVITENKFILAQFRTGKGRVAYQSVTDLYTNHALSTLDCYLSMKEVLRDAGYKFVEEGADIDLTNLSKDSLMELLTRGQ